MRPPASGGRRASGTRVLRVIDGPTPDWEDVDEVRECVGGARGEEGRGVRPGVMRLNLDVLRVVDNSEGRGSGVSAELLLPATGSSSVVVIEL